MPSFEQIINPVLDVFTTSEGWLAFSLGVLGKHIVVKLRDVYKTLREGDSK